MEQIQGKSIFVLVRASFETPRVRVSGSQLYFKEFKNLRTFGYSLIRRLACDSDYSLVSDKSRKSIKFGTLILETI